jgi:dihydroorotate dehydrogenase
MSYRGPGIVYEIKKGVKEQLEKEGKTWKDIVGSAVA